VTERREPARPHRDVTGRHGWCGRFDQRSWKCFDSGNPRCDGVRVEPDPDREAVFTKYGSGDQIADAALSDGVVLKRSGAWTPGVIALLRHLEQMGFAGAPRVVGSGYAADGRLAVTYVPGESPHPRAWSDEAAGRTGELLRRLHTATTGFAAPADAVWQHVWLRDVTGEKQVVGHVIPARGTSSATTVRRGHSSIGSSPDRSTRCGSWPRPPGSMPSFMTMTSPSCMDCRMRRPAPGKPGRSSTVMGLGRAAREDFCDRLLDAAVHGARAEVLLHGVTAQSTVAVADDGYPVLWGIAWRARSASWMARNRQLLRRALR
jgi:hypothetical protein